MAGTRMFTNIYKALCLRGKKLQSKYGKNSGLHRHHITPVHSGGTNDESNITYLSIREHIIAHYLLWKINKNENDLRSMHMLGARLTTYQRRIVGIWCKKNEIGFHSKKWKAHRKKWSRKGVQTQIKVGIGIHDSKNYAKFAALGGKVGAKEQQKRRLGIFNEKKRKTWAKLGGLAMKGIKNMTNGKIKTKVRPERIQEFLDRGFWFGWSSKTNTNFS